MSVKVDFNRPYGQVYGEASHSYEQDGKFFGHDGREVAGPADESAPKPARTYAKRVKAEPALASPVDAELSAQMAS